MNAIKTNQLTKNYKELCAVNNLNLTVKEGELFALLGVNGAGKTTTIKMLSGILQPTSGDAEILGESIIKNINEVKKIINVSPQETAIAPNLTVKENLEFIGEIYGLSPTKLNGKINQMIKEFSLEKVINKKADTLSGGYQRRLSIALGLISEPKVLFLDEPTLGLDVIARRELWDIIEALKGKMTIVLTTHYMEEAEKLSDNIAIMKDGNLIASGTAKELMKQSNTTNFEEAFVTLVREAK